MGADRGRRNLRRALGPLLRAALGLALAAAWLAHPGPAQVEDYESSARILLDDRARPDPQAARQLPEVDLQTRAKDVRIEPVGGANRVLVPGDDRDVSLTPEEYVAALARAQERQRSEGWLFVVFNITKPIGFVWVAVGFLGQALFTFRMLLQWWASEKHKRSIVPVGFWWGSLFGGLMLFVYFCWRKDVVGIVGQSTGVFIYARNLVLIYRGAPAA